MKRRSLIVLAAIITSLLFVVACEREKKHESLTVKVDLKKLMEFISTLPPDNPPKTLTLKCQHTNGEVYCDPWE